MKLYWSSRCSAGVRHECKDYKRLAARLIFGLAIVGLAPAASAVVLTKIGNIVPGYNASTESSDMPIADFDGDGLSDIVVLGHLNYSDSIQIVGMQTGTGWRIKQAIVPNTGYFYPAPNVATWTDTNGAHLLYMRGYQVSVYGGWPLTLEHEFRLVDYVEFTDAQVADVDNDGVPELILAASFSSHAVRAYSLMTGAELWEADATSSYGPRLDIAQLDPDPALEILLTGMPGTVIDGATHAVEWQYKDGFAALVEHGRFGGLTPRFASLGSRLVMFQGQPWSPLWDIDDVSAQTAAVADIDGDQIDELICSSNSFPDGIRIYDVQTQALRTSFDEDRAIQMAAANFDGNSGIEIAIGMSPYFYAPGGTSFRVLSATSGSEVFGVLATAPGPYLAGGFVADAGAVDMIFASAGTSGLAGTITRLDSAGGDVRWRTSSDDPLLNLYSVRSLVVANLSGQPQPVIIASGRGNYPNYSDTVALRSSDGSVLWHINSSTGPIPGDVSLEAISAVDLDGDTMADALLACTSEPRLRLFNASDQSQIWSSVAMSGECRGALQVTIGGHRQLVAVLSGAVRAYDAQTHLLSWSLPYPTGMSGASYLPQGLNGPEFALFGSSGFSFYDAETRSLLRELSIVGQPGIQAVVQPPGASIHDLVVTMEGRLHVLDGVSGVTTASSEPLGLNAGQFNQIAVRADVDGSALIGVGTDVAVSTLRVGNLSDSIFASGFDPTTR